MTDRRRRRAQVLIAILAVVVVTAVIAFVPWNNDDDKKPTTLPTPTFGTQLDANGSALATLMSGARNHTFHAHYKVRGDAKLIGGALELEWWNKPGHSRIDTTRTREGETVKTASIVDGDKGVGCQQVNADAWTCREIDVPGPGDPGGIVATLTSQLAGRHVTQHADKIKGHRAICFHVAGGTEPIDICTDIDGVLLRNASPNVAYEITSLDRNVPDSTFTPPAKVKR